MLKGVIWCGDGNKLLSKDVGHLLSVWLAELLAVVAEMEERTGVREVEATKVRRGGCRRG
jgi:hypothetical protein